MAIAEMDWVRKRAIVLRMTMIYFDRVINLVFDECLASSRIIAEIARNPARILGWGVVPRGRTLRTPLNEALAIPAVVAENWDSPKNQ